MPSSPAAVAISLLPSVVAEGQSPSGALGGKWYWHRYRDVWYRTRDHRGGWVVAQRQYVPVMLTRFPPGKYRRHHPGNGPRWVYVQEPDGRVTEVKGNGKVKVKGGNHGHGRWGRGDH